MANEIPIGGLQLEFTDVGSKNVAQTISDLAQALIALRDASKGGNLSTKAKQLNAIVKSIDSIKSSSVENLNNLANSITAIGSVSPSSELVNMFNSLGESVEGVDTSKMEEIKDSVSDLSSVSAGENPTKEIGQGFIEAQENAEAFEVTAHDVADSMAQIKEQSVSDTAEDFNKVAESAQDVSNKTIQARDSAKAFKQEIQTINGNKYKEVETALGSIFVSANMSEKNVKTLTKSLDGIAKAKNGIKTVTGGIKKLGSALFGAHSFAGKLLKSFVRIAFYRSIRFSLSSMVKGFKEGATNLYKWSDAFDKTRTFANSMDKIATSILYVKNSLGALVAPIINSVAPAIDFLADKFVELLNWVNEFIAVFTGASTFTVARKVPTHFEDVAKSAGKASKALKSYTLGIDELNIIEDNAGAGGGYGGMSDIAKNWFETKQVSQNMKNIVDDVKGYIDEIVKYAEYMNPFKSWKTFEFNTDSFWTDVGTFIVEDLFPVMSPIALYIEAFNNIKTKATEAWNAVKTFGEWVHKVVTNPDYLNVTVNGLKDFYTGFNAWSAILDGTLEGIRKISDSIRDLKAEFKKDPFGTTVDSVAKILAFVSPLPAIFGALKINLDSIKATADNIKRAFKKVAEFVGTLAKTKPDKWLETIKNFKWEDEAQKGANKYVNTFEKTVRGKNPTKGIFDGAEQEAQSKGASIGKTFNNSLNNAVTGNSLKSKGASIGSTVLSTFKNTASYNAFKTAGEDIIKGINKGLDSKKGELYKKIEDVAKKTGSTFNAKLGIKSPSKVFAESGKWIVAGLNKGIEDNEGTTSRVVDSWVSSFSNITPKFDISNLALPDITSMITDVSGAVRTNNEITTQAMTGDMAEFFTSTLMPVINQIANDAKRQADKDETITLDGRKVTSAVNRQNRTNGYSFT